MVNAAELPGPAYVVEEGAEVKAVVIRAVALSVVRRSHCGHLVPVGRVHPEEMLHFCSHLISKRWKINADSSPLAITNINK